MADTENSYCIIYNDEAKNVFAFTAFGWNGQTFAIEKGVIGEKLYFFTFYYTLESFNIEMVRLGQPEISEDDDPFKEEK